MANSPPGTQHMSLPAAVVMQTSTATVDGRAAPA